MLINYVQYLDRHITLCVIRSLLLNINICSNKVFIVKAESTARCYLILINPLETGYCCDINLFILLLLSVNMSLFQHLEEMLSLYYMNSDVIIRFNYFQLHAGVLPVAKGWGHVSYSMVLSLSFLTPILIFWTSIQDYTITTIKRLF